MTEKRKIVTKYVVLKISYDSYINEPPDTWGWNELIEAKEQEKIELTHISDIPIIPNKLF